ncbi:MAG: hypothetical protein H0Z30_09280 [Candidatus Marinimicrobia bacterium]|nr:hypothetical protein [Candidatus Neomarinimicrobiota bacterium]
MSEKTKNYIKVKFKGSHKQYFENPLELPAEPGEYVIVEADRGEDIGVVCGIKRNSSEVNLSDEEKFCVLRKALEEDLKLNMENRVRELYAFEYCERKIEELELPMKLMEVEYRLDRKKLTFYFTADDRIDFRELVKILAAEFKTRIEMRQISTREEIRKAGGVGPCGLPVCCRRWITKFEPVSTQHVKSQNLPMNPVKVSGNCGKLKCCYRYEYEMYAEILKNYPPYGSKVEVNGKEGVIEKIEIFQGTVTIKFNSGDMEDYPLSELGKKIKVIEIFKEERTDEEQ